MIEMIKDQERVEESYTLEELQKKAPRMSGLSGDRLTYYRCANYARLALLANLNAISEGKTERLYQRTEQQMIDESKVLYNNYRDALNKALMLT